VRGGRGQRAGSGASSFPFRPPHTRPVCLQALRRPPPTRLEEVATSQLPAQPPISTPVSSSDLTASPYPPRQRSWPQRRGGAAERRHRREPIAAISDHAPVDRRPERDGPALSLAGTRPAPVAGPGRPTSSDSRSKIPQPRRQHGLDAALAALWRHRGAAVELGEPAGAAGRADRSMRARAHLAVPEKCKAYRETGCGKGSSCPIAAARSP
jgi:hypothetical protein